MSSCTSFAGLVRLFTYTDTFILIQTKLRNVSAYRHKSYRHFSTFVFMTICVYRIAMQIGLRERNSQFEAYTGDNAGDDDGNGDDGTDDDATLAEVVAKVRRVRVAMIARDTL